MCLWAMIRERKRRKMKRFRQDSSKVLCTHSHRIGIEMESYLLIEELIYGSHYFLVNSQKTKAEKGRHHKNVVFHSIWANKSTHEERSLVLLFAHPLSSSDKTATPAESLFISSLITIVCKLANLLLTFTSTRNPPVVMSFSP